jgi:hypothetical protein
MLEKYNNLVTKYKPQDYAQTSPDNEVGNEMRKISTGLDVSLKNALTIMYGNLSSTCYENLTIDRCKKNYNSCYDVLKSIFDRWDSNGNKNISDMFRKGDLFIVFNELLSNIYHKLFLSLRTDGIKSDAAIATVSNLGEQLSEHISKIDPAAFFILKDKSPNGVTRKRFFKEKLKQILLNRSKTISKEYRESTQKLNGSPLKKIIEIWADEGKNSNNGYNKVSD